MTSRIRSSGTIENSIDTSMPIATPCAAAFALTPYSASARSDVDDRSASGIAATAVRAITTPSRLPASPSVMTCRMYMPMIWRLVPPTHFRTAMLFIFWSTKTRTTLETAMPPRITITSPTRLR